MKICATCLVCGTHPSPEKMEMNELYACTCECGLTCIGSTPEKAVDCWNHQQDSEANK